MWDIERACYAQAGFLEDVGVDLGGGDVGVAEEFLDGADVVAGLEEMGGEGMAEGVATDWFGNLAELDGVADGALEDEFVEMRASLFFGTRIFGDAARG